MAKECPYGGPFCQSKCFLLQQVEGQSTTGGLDANNQPGGPIFQKDVWRRLVERTASTASTDGCLKAAELPKALKKITQGKQQRRELR